MGLSDVDIAVVGGGLAGLTAARELARAGADFVLLERDRRLGGRILSYDRRPYWLNFGAHLFGGPSSTVGRMIGDYGLRVEPAHGSITAIAYRGRVIRPPLPEALPLMFPAPLRSRIALARAGLKLRRQARKLQALGHAFAGADASDRDGTMLSFLDDRTFADLLGELPADVDALFRAFSNRAGAPPEELSAGSGVAAFALVLKKDAALGSNIVGGSSRLIEALATEVNSRAMCGCDVSSIVLTHASADVRYAIKDLEEELRARAVIVATPAPVTRRIVTGLPETMRDALGKINYNTSVVAAFLTNETKSMPWDDIYALTVPDRSFNMFFNQANVLREPQGPRKPGGSLMVYGNGALGLRLLEESDETIIARFTSDLDEIFPGAKDVIAEAIVHRWDGAAPYAEPGRGEVHAALSRCLPPLFFAGDYLGASFSETAALTGAEAARAALAFVNSTRSLTHAGGGSNDQRRPRSEVIKREPPLNVSADSWTARRILVDRIDSDTIALARFLAQCGAEVCLATPVGPPARLASELQALSDAGITVRVEADMTALAVDSDVIFVHDYTSPREQFVRFARQQGKVVTQLADLILSATRALVVGVTGSAGKSTTAMLTAEILQRSGVTVHVSRQHYLPQSPSPNREHLELLGVMRSTDAAVLELTSSHLEYVNTSPNVAVITTIWPDHLEWHGTLDRYLAAKARIMQFQTSDDWAVLNSADGITRSYFQSRCRGKCVLINDPTSPFGVFRDGEMLVCAWDGVAEPLVSINDVRLGVSYLGNAMSAVGAALAAGGTIEGAREALVTFAGLAGRLELVAEADGIRVVNDSVALTPGKARSGLETFEGQSVILICGGRDIVDGWSVAPLHSSPEEEREMRRFCEVAGRRVRRAFIFGSAGDRLTGYLTEHGFPPRRIQRLDTLEAATSTAIRSAEPGTVVVLAPVFDPGQGASERFVRLARDEIEARLARR